MTRVGVVGAAGVLGQALVARLLSDHKVHAIRSWDESRAEAGIDKIASLTRSDSLMDALNGCEFAVWCVKIQTDDDDAFAREHSLGVRAFLQACRDAQVNRSVVVLSATTMLENQTLSPSNHYTPGQGTARDDAVYSTEQDIARFRADAMDVCVVNTLPLGASKGDRWVTSLDDLIDSIVSRLDHATGGLRKLSAPQRGRILSGEFDNPLFHAVETLSE